MMTSTGMRALATMTLAVVSWTQTPASEPLLALKGLDPVELTKGREVSGDPGLTSALGHYRYNFSSAASRELFLKDPMTYAIQMGGSCARMGPFSGLGDPGRYHVQDGRIYIFASDACMNRFRTTPDRFVPRADPMPTATAEETARGGALMALALKGLGGADRVDAVSGVRMRSVRTHGQGKEASESAMTYSIRLPGDFRREESWPGGSASVGLSGNRGFRIEKNEAWGVDEQEQRLIRRDMLTQPLALLRARGEPGFRAAAAGGGTVGDAAVEWLRIWHEGTQVTLGIELTTGRILTASFRGRTATGMGDVMGTWSDFREVSGLMLPFASVVSHDGKPVTDEPVTLAELVINPEFPDELFSPVK